jgi:hypothetical protein
VRWIAGMWPTQSGNQFNRVWWTLTLARFRSSSGSTSKPRTRTLSESGSARQTNGISSFCSTAMSEAVRGGSPSRGSTSGLAGRTSVTSLRPTMSRSAARRYHYPMTWRPNMRVQRTRSSPSALRSPLTRYPLGSRKCLVGIWLLGAAACVSVQGRLYPAWNPYAITVSYSSVTDAVPTPTLRVQLVGRNAAFLPSSMTVLVYRSGDHSSARYHLDSQENPSVFTALPAGTWELEIALLGTTQSPGKPAHCRVDLRPGQVCTVEIVIVEEHEIVVV